MNEIKFIQLPGSAEKHTINADLLDGKHASEFAAAADVNEKVSKSGDTMTGNLVLNKSNPSVNFVPSSASAKEYRIISNDDSSFCIQNRNRGSSEAWKNRISYSEESSSFDKITFGKSLNAITKPNVAEFAISNLFGNPFYGIDPRRVIIEVSMDNGLTWGDAGVSDANKRLLFDTCKTSGNKYSFPKKDGAYSTDVQIRVTVSNFLYNVPQDTPETEKYSYWNNAYATGSALFNGSFSFFSFNTYPSNHIIDIECANMYTPDTWVPIVMGVPSGSSNGVTGFALTGVDYNRRFYSKSSDGVYYFHNLRFTIKQKSVNSNYASALRAIVGIGQFTSVPNHVCSDSVPYTVDSGTLKTTFDGNIAIKNGTSSQFLKANGSVDSTTYATAALVSDVASALQSDIDDANSRMEVKSNKVTTLDNSDTHYPTSKAIKQYVDDLIEEKGGKLYLAVSSTAAGTLEKTASLSGFVLETGKMILLKLENTSSVANATLNVNGTGAKKIKLGGLNTSTYNFTAGYYYMYYDGTYWNAIFQDKTVFQRGISSSGYTNWRSLVIGGASSSDPYFTPGSSINETIVCPWIKCQPSTGIVRANKFTVPGGTSAQFLKGDGSIDDLVYMTGDIPYISVQTTYSLGCIKAEDGTVGSSSNNHYTDYIDVEGYIRIKFLGIKVNSSLITGYAFYDSDKNWISSLVGNWIIDSSLTDHIPYEYTIRIPANAKYFRTTIRDAQIQLSDFYCKLQKDGYSTILDIRDDLQTGIDDLLDNVFGKEDKTNKVTIITSSSTDTQYPSAKCVHDMAEYGQDATVFEEHDVIRFFPSAIQKSMLSLSLSMQSPSVDFSVDLTNASPQEHHVIITNQSGIYKQINFTKNNFIGASDVFSPEYITLANGYSTCINICWNKNNGICFVTTNNATRLQ